MFGLLIGRSKPLLVIGSCHLDIFADQIISDGESGGDIKVKGQILIAAGGSGFNVAMSLALNKEKVELYTKMNPWYIGRPAITTELRASGVKSQIDYDRSIDSYFFIAHRSRHDGRLDIDKAIANDGIISPTMSGTKLRKLIRRSRGVVLCCNYPTSELRLVIDECRTFSRPLFMCGVGEQLVTRISDIRDKLIGLSNFELLSLDRGEAIRLVESFTRGRRVPKWTQCSELAMEILTELGCEAVSISDGPQGVRLFMKSAKEIVLTSPDVPIIESTTGAGDACFAALVAHIAAGETFDAGHETMSQKVDRFIRPVLRSPYANTSRAYFHSERESNPKQLQVIEHRIRIRERWFAVWLMLGGTAAGAALGAAATLLLQRWII